MNINIEFINESETIALFFIKDDSIKHDGFKNLTLLIDALCSGHFCYHPYDGYEEELMLFIKSVDGKQKTIFVKIEKEGLSFGFLKSRS